MMKYFLFLFLFISNTFLFADILHYKHYTPKKPIEKDTSSCIIISNEKKDSILIHAFNQFNKTPPKSFESDWNHERYKYLPEQEEIDAFNLPDLIIKVGEYYDNKYPINLYKNKSHEYLIEKKKEILLKVDMPYENITAYKDKYYIKLVFYTKCVIQYKDEEYGYYLVEKTNKYNNKKYNEKYWGVINTTYYEYEKFIEHYNKWFEIIFENNSYYFKEEIKNDVTMNLNLNSIVFHIK